MADSTRLLSETITVTLTVTDNEAVADADATPTAVICLREQTVFTIEAGDVSNPSTGVYTFSFSPTKTGLHVVEWSWTYGGEDYTSEFRIQINADPAGEVEDDSPAEDADTDPDIGTGNVCTVTATFYDANGNGMQGVYVRFTPLNSTDAFLSSGTIVLEAAASSDSDGAFSMELVRNVLGTLAITGLGIVRQVRVPDVSTITLEDLVALADDLLEVQTPQFVKLPRRS